MQETQKKQTLEESLPYSGFLNKCISFDCCLVVKWRQTVTNDGLRQFRKGCQSIQGQINLIKLFPPMLHAQPMKACQI